MSNDMPEIIYAWKDEAGYCDFWKEDKDYMEGGIAYYSESHVQHLIQDAVSEAKREATKGYVTKVAYDALKNNLEQLIKEAEKRQREKCASAYIDGCYELAESENRLIVEAILNAGGE